MDQDILAEPRVGGRGRGARPPRRRRQPLRERASTRPAPVRGVRQPRAPVCVHQRHNLESGRARSSPHHSRPDRGHSLGRARGREGDGVVATPRTEPADPDPGRGGVGASSKPLRGSRRRRRRAGSREGAVPVLRVRSKTHRIHRARRQGAAGARGSAGARAARGQLPRGVHGGGETRSGTSAGRGGGVRPRLHVGARDGHRCRSVGCHRTRGRAGDGRGDVAAGWPRGTSLGSVARGGGGVRTPAGRLLPVQARGFVSQATGGGGGGPGERLHPGTAPAVRGVRDPARPSRGRETLRRRRGGIGVSAVHGVETDESGRRGG